MWYNQGVGDISQFLREFKSRLWDVSKQEWSSRLEQSTRAVFYRSFKKMPCFGKYLDVVTSKLHRQALFRLLISSHQLRTESGRWDNTERGQRFFVLCVNDIEDEFILY